ncbi:MAG TPA: helical backbone metal receptor [Ramlibacter sp.]
MRRWFVLLLLACALPVHAITVTDDLGKSVRFDRPPQRIVSLMPSLTEIACALGACGRLVAVDDYSNHPAQVRSLPHVGGMEDARVETIFGLRPDLVLAPTSSRALDRLQSLGLKVLAVEPRTFADVRRVLELLGPVLAAKDGEQVWRETERGIAQAARELPVPLRGLRVYFEVSTAPYAASESSFVGELLARIGARNIVPGALGPFPQLNPEFIVRADPDLIMLAHDEPAGRIETRPGWHRLRAVRAGRVCAFTDEERDVLVRAGPGMADAARLMVRCLRDKAGSAAR